MTRFTPFSMKISALAYLGLALLAPLHLHSKAPARTLELHILHTNDLHSRIEPFEDGNGFESGKGGAARRASVIQKVRSEAKHLLLLDAGDALQGTPYFQSYKGILDYQVMNRLGYDAGTLGNHEFDLGLSGLEHALKVAKFPIVNCNYDFSVAPKLASHIRPYVIREMGGFKIGITGVGIRLKDLVPGRNWEGVIFRDPVEAVRQVVHEMRFHKGVDMVIVLSHMGTIYHQAHMDDQRLAQRVKGIDLIIGGHTHTPTRKPVEVKKNGWVTHLVQGRLGGTQIGHLVFELQNLNTRSLVLR